MLLSVVYIDNSTSHAAVRTIPCLTSKGVSGVTSLSDEIFVVRQCSRTVDVYDPSTLKLRRSLRIPVQTSHSSLAACGTNNCIYVSVHNLCRVYKLAADESRPSTSCFTVEQKPRGLSVNSAGNLFVACCDSNKIQEFTSFGQLVREIRMQSDLTNPMHFVELANDQFGLTHAAVLNRFCVVDGNGCLVKSFGSSAGNGADQLNWPTRVAVGKHGIVFIVSFQNHCVLKFDLSTFAATRLDVDLVYPYCVHYDASRDWLYIGEMGGQQRLLVVEY